MLKQLHSRRVKLRTQLRMRRTREDGHVRLQGIIQRVAGLHFLLTLVLLLA